MTIGKEVLYLASDNLVRVKNLRSVSVVSGDFTNTASVYMTLVDSGTENEAPNIIWPVGLTLVDSATGQWEGIIPDTTSVVEGGAYEAKIVADAGPNFLTTWFIPVVVKKRIS
jgi:hypothetical protein